MLETKSLSIFEQKLLAEISNRDHFKMDYPFQEAKDLERFLGPNCALIRTFGNSLSTLNDTEWSLVETSLRKISFMKRQSAFRAIKSASYKSSGLHWDELLERTAMEKTTDIALRSITSVSWLGEKRIIQAAGAAAVEITIFDVLQKLPQAPVFLPIFLNAGVNIHTGKASLIAQLVYHLE